MKKFLLIIIALLMLSASACGLDDSAPVEEAEALYSFADDLGRRVQVERAERVAVMIGSFADLWCLAGGHDSIVAAADDSWTSFQLDLDENVVNLGAIKTPNLEALIAAAPDFVIASCNTASNVELMDTFEKLGITVAYFDVQSFDDYLNMLDICTWITGQRDNYKAYGTDILTVVEAAIARQDGSAPSILCLRATGSSCAVKKSSGNLLGEMLAQLGCVNVADSGSSALEALSLEAIMEADPDYIFAVLQGSDPTAAESSLKAALLSNPAWSGLRAVQEGRFYTLDNSLYNLKPNARWGEAYEKLADILYGQ